jgi:hypothetical protein
MRPLLELDKAVPVKLQESALIELPISKLGLLTTDVGAGVGAALTMDEVMILDDDTRGITAETIEEADTEAVEMVDALGVEDKTTVEEGAGDEDGEDKTTSVVFDVEVKAVVAVTIVELIIDGLRTTTLDDVGAEEDTGALEVEETNSREVEATTDDDIVGLVTVVAAAADEGIGVEEYAAVVDEDAGATLMSR